MFPLLAYEKVSQLFVHFTADIGDTNVAEITGTGNRASMLSLYRLCY